MVKGARIQVNCIEGGIGQDDASVVACCQKNSLTVLFSPRACLREAASAKAGERVEVRGSILLVNALNVNPILNFGF